MPVFTGAGSIWTMATGTFVATPYAGTAAGLTQAKADLVATGGIIQMGPGLEAVALGNTGWGGVHPVLGISLIRIALDHGVTISRFHIADAADPTKSIHFALASITTGTERTIEFADWSGIVPVPINTGNAGEFLKSNGGGVQPSWNAVTLTNALLDASNHSDTVAQAVSRGSIIIGNSTPKWDELTIGASGSVLYSDGTDPSWTLLSSLTSHDLLGHIQPFSAANCNWTGAVTTITTSGNAFANVKVGDFVYIGGGLAGVGNQGRRVAVWNNANSIDVDVAKTGSDLVNGTIIFVPGDHWNDTLAPDSFGAGVGYMLASGRGTFTQTGPGTTFQELRGPIRWMGHANGSVSTDFRVQGSTSAGSPFGFSIWKSTTVGVWFMVNNLTASRVLTVPDVSDEITLIGAPQTITNKTFTTGNVIRMDETGATTNGTAFRDRAGTTKGLGFDLTNITAGQNRVAVWPNYGGRVPLEGAAVTFSDGDTTPSVSGSRLFKTNNTGATSITTFDDGVAGEEITVVFGDVNTTLVDGATLVMAGSANKTFAATDVWTGIFDGSVWYEKSRSIN